MRPMVLAYPDEERLYRLEDQFMCGSEMLVAPVFSCDGERVVELPAGTWFDFWTGKPVPGGGQHASIHPMATFPVYVRQGGIVPMESSPRKGAAEQSELEIHIFGAADGTFQLHDAGRPCEIRCLWAGAENKWTVHSGPLLRREIVWKLYGMPHPAEVLFTENGGCPTPLKAGAASPLIVKTPTKGGELTIRF